MASGNLPVVLLLGAKSATHPLASIPAELSSLKALFEARQADTGIPSFAVQYEPYFTQEQLKTTLDQLAGRVAILHFAGHSDGGALLSDDQAVNARQVAAHISTWAQPPDLIFLNGCHNAGQVEAFHAAGVPVVIATHRAIDDVQAAGFAREFYASLLANGGQASVQAAFQQAGSKVLLSDTRQARSLDIEELRRDDAQSWDWSLFPRQPQQTGWTLRQLLTHERPRFDDKGQLINPYRGLEAFREEDRAYFFGREALTGELCEKVPAARLFALWGASGSGKSSLVSAGVIPRLRESGGWLILKTRPGNDPFRLLAAEIALVFHPDIRSNRDQETAGLVEQLKNASLHWPDKIADLLQTSHNQRLLLFIDQFEELFTQSNAATARAYEAQLIRLVEAKLPHCTLLLVMRADFLAAALANEAFTKLLDQSPAKLLPPMGQAELRAAIEQPASKQRVTVETALTEALLDAVENQPGSLPLLQYVLSLLWEQRGDDGLRLEDYNRFGGLEKALEIRANSILDGFSAIEQEQAKHIFLRLIQPGEGSEDTRRRADLSEFGDDPAARHILKALADARLITTQQDEHDHDAFAEVSHEALIRHWGKLREWIADNRDALRTRNQISKSAKDWDEGGRDASWLLTGSRLAVAQEWLKTNVAQASELEAEFVEASIQERDRLKNEKERVRRRNRNTLVGFVVMLAMIALVAVWQWQDANESKMATDNANKSLSNKILESNYHLAKAFEEKAIFSLEQGHKEKKAGNLIESIDQYRKAWLYALETEKLELPAGKKGLSNSSIRELTALDEKTLIPERLKIPSLYLWGKGDSVAYNANAQIIASAADFGRGRIKLWDAETGRELKTLEGHEGSISKLAFSPDGRTLVSSSDDEIVKLWDVQKGLELKTIRSRSADAYSPNGNIIAGTECSMDVCQIQLWDARTGELLEKSISIQDSGVTAITFSPDSKGIIAALSNNTINIWNMDDGKLLKTLEGYEDNVSALAYGLDGKTIVSISDNSQGDFTVRIWDLQSGDVLKHFLLHNESILALMNDDGNGVVALGVKEKILQTWNIMTGETIKILSGQENHISSIAYSQDGKIIAIGLSDGIIQLLDANKGEIQQVLKGHSGQVNVLIYSPDGKVIVSGSNDNTVRLWDLSIGALVKTLEAHIGAVKILLYSPDGKTIASGSDDNTVRLWETSTGKVLKTLNGHSGSLYALSYNPNGKIIASSDINTLRLWDIVTGENLKTYSNVVEPHSNDVNLMSYSPDGKSIALSAGYGIQIFNPSTGKMVKGDSVGYKINALIYSPDGRSIASGDWGNSIRLWDASNGKQKLEIKGHKGAVTKLFYSSDGKIIVSGSEDNTIRLWDASTGKALKVLRSYSADHLVSSITALSLSADGNVIASSSSDGVLQVGDVYNDDVVKRINVDDNCLMINRLNYSSDGGLISTTCWTSDDGNSEAEIWNVRTGESPHMLSDYLGYTRGLSFSPNGEVVAVSLSQNPDSSSSHLAAYLLDMVTGKVLHVLNNACSNTSSLSCPLLYSPDGTIVASNSGDDVFLWNANTGELLKKIHRNVYYTSTPLIFSPDNKVIAMSSDNEVLLHDIRSGNILKTLQGHADYVRALVYSPDGKMIASGANDGAVLIWDVNSGKILKTLKKHAKSISSLVYTPDGKVLISSAGGNAIYFWDVTTGEVLRTLEVNDAPEHEMTMSPDGKFLAFNEGSNVIRILDLNSSSSKIFHDFDPHIVSGILKFLWELDMDGLDVKDTPRALALRPQEGGYYITFTEETKKYIPLLSPPFPNESKLDQVVRFLEAECAYKDPEQKAACEAKKP